MEDLEGIEKKVRDAADALGVSYKVLPCDPELADTREFCAHYGVALDESANTILVASKKKPRKYAACLVLATTRLDVNHRVRELMGVKKLSFANAAETLEVTEMMIGGVTLFGLPPELPIYVDRRVTKRSRIVVGGGSRSCKLELAPEAFGRIPQVEIVDDLAIPLSPKE